MSTPTNEQREADEAKLSRLLFASTQLAFECGDFREGFDEGHFETLYEKSLAADAALKSWALSRIEELAKDAGRLDWLSQLGEGSYMHKDLVDYWPNGGRDWAAFTEQARDDSDPTSSHATLREAIDAAMQAQAAAEFDAANPRSQCVLESDHDGEHQLETPAASSSGANTP